MAQIFGKINLLCDDLATHEPLKKRLHGAKGDLYRQRSSNYRIIIYPCGNGLVTLVGVDGHKDVYKNGFHHVDIPAISAKDIPDVADLLTPDAWFALVPAAASPTSPRPRSCSSRRLFTRPSTTFPSAIPSH